MPLIALTPCWDTQNEHLYVPNDYVTAVQAAGGAPVVCSFTDSQEMADEMMAHADALLLTGGADVDPAVYHEEMLPFCGELALMRDKLEPMLIRAALKHNRPILGICRGLQIVNATLGGTLYQDIAEQYGKQVLHPRSDRPRDGVHNMSIAAGSMLEAAYGCREVMVNSRHHQACKVPAPCLKVVGIAEDGLVEGLESTSGTPILCVQWHPESMRAAIPVHMAVFNWIVREASR